MAMHNISDRMKRLIKAGRMLAERRRERREQDRPVQQSTQPQPKGK